MTEIGNWTNAQVCSWLKAVQLGSVVPSASEPEGEGAWQTARRRGGGRKDRRGGGA